MLKGTIKELGPGLKGYIVGENTGATSAVIMLSDIFGYDTGKHRLMCDMLSERLGCVAVCPDFFHGKANGLEELKPSCSCFCGFCYRLPSLLRNLKGTKWSMIRHDLDITISYLKAQGVTKAGTIGFCWGAYGVWRAAGEEDLSNFLVCGVSAHPSVHNCAGMVGDPFKPLEIVARTRHPQLVLSSKDEPQDWWPGGAVEAAVNGIPAAAGSRIRVFQECRHGWMARSDWNDPANRLHIDDAFDDSVKFFKDVGRI